MSTLDQAKRFLNITTPLGENELVLTGFRGQEQISRLFRFELDLLSDNASVTPKDLIGQSVTFSTEYQKDERRHFNGIVSRFSIGNLGINKRRSYRIDVVPKFWLLQKRSDCRIFQQMTVADILKKVLAGLDTKFELNGPYATRDYCVQYRETDFNFASRLMEEEGIFYYFLHEDGKHTMVIGDNADAYDTAAGPPIDYPAFTGRAEVKNTFSSWEHVHEMRTGKWTQRDYNFETPLVTLETNSQATTLYTGADQLEYYDYPGLYSKTSDGKPLTDVRMGEEEFDIDVVHGSSNVSTLSAGLKFEIGDHQWQEEKGRKYIVSVVHHIANEPLAYETGTAPSVDYTNSFTALPETIVVRPDRITPKPVIQGLQTAVVVGPKGEEIYCDKYGRIKVQFFWDRQGQKNESSSCWMRTTHNIAGKNWGMMVIPRIGQEVVINFLEGDPDRPIVLGCVFNADQMPPNSLPGKQNQMSLKSNSTKGGVGHNELTLDDTAGKEMFYMHAQYDMHTRVDHDRVTTVMHNEDYTVQLNDTRTVGTNQSLNIGANKTESIGASQTETIGANVNINVGSDRNEAIGKNQHTDIGGELHTTVAKDVAASYGENASLAVAKDRNESVGGQYALSVSKAMHVSATNEIVLSAKKITLKAMDSFITLDPSGVTIKGKMIKLNSGGGAIEAKGAKITVAQVVKNAVEAVKAREAMKSVTGAKSAP